MAGYHQKIIVKGEFGELSKIFEEFTELEDASAQGSRIMALVELSDMVGAIQAYLAKKYPTFTLEDLVTMANITKRAFEDGTRK